MKIQFIKILKHSKNSAGKEEPHKPKASGRREIKIREVNETETENNKQKNPHNQGLVILSIKLINL